MSSQEYRELCIERDMLKSLIAKGGPKHLVKELELQLKEIRTTLQNEHREQHNREQGSRGGPSR